jgi:hypothetical protein
MGMTALLLMFLVATPSLTLEVPSLGIVSAFVYGRGADDGGPQRVVFKSSPGVVLGDFTLNIGDSPTQVDLRALPPDGVLGPLVVAVAHMLGADGVRIRVALFGFEGGRVRSLLPLVVNLEAEDGLCVGDLGPQQPTGAAAIRAVFGGECFLCWPKRFEAVLFTWDGARLSRVRTLRTRRRHESWERAARELGLDCKDEVSPTVFQNE